MAQPLPPCSPSSSIPRTISYSQPPRPHLPNTRRDEVSLTPRNRSKKRNAVLYCTSTTATSSSQSSTESTSLQVWARPVVELGREKQFDNLTTQFGWRVRRLVADNSNEVREVAQVQAEAFHTPVALFDFLFFDFFKAEVLSGLLYKLRHSAPDRYACLVAERADEDSTSPSKLVGVVDASAARDADVLKCLVGVQEYLYISGIGVLSSCRRQKVGSVLLTACDNVGNLWGFDYLALRAYADDTGARSLYEKAGYRVASSDPQWFALIGWRPRVLMIKRL